MDKTHFDANHPPNHHQPNTSADLEGLMYCTWFWLPNLPRNDVGAISAMYLGVYSDAAPAPAAHHSAKHQSMNTQCATWQVMDPPYHRCLKSLHAYQEWSTKCAQVHGSL